MSKKLATNFHHAFAATIWQILPVSGTDWLLIELRDVEGHQASFALYDLEAQQLLWDGLGFEENWWVGITAAQQGIALFHIYENNSNPDEKSYFALDLASQEVVWQIEDCMVDLVKDGTVLANQSQGDQSNFFSIALVSGEESAINAQEYKQLLLENKEIAKNKAILSPFHYVEGHAYFDTVARFLAKQVQVQPKRAMDYLEYPVSDTQERNAQYIIVAYYTENEELLTNYLLITGQDGAVLYHEPIGNQLERVGMETFFVHQGKLVVIRDKTELLIFDL